LSVMLPEGLGDNGGSALFSVDEFSSRL
jgi:hypothetical protein